MKLQLGGKDRILSPDAYTSTTELINHPAIGLSECSAAVLNLNSIVKDGVAAKIFHPLFALEWNSVWQEFNMQIGCENFNASENPGADRTSASLRKAMVPVCQMGNHVRRHGADSVPFLGFGSSLMVDNSWLLSFASQTIPGQFAQKIKDVLVPSEPAMATLLANLATGKYLIQFLVAEVHANHGVLLAAQTSQAAGA